MSPPEDHPRLTRPGERYRERVMALGGFTRQPGAMYPTFYVKRDDVLALADEVFGSFDDHPGAVETERTWCEAILDTDQRDDGDGRVLATLANMARTRLRELEGQ